MPAPLKRMTNVRDNLYTPKILVDIIVPYLKQWHSIEATDDDNLVVWCPFDTEESEYVYMCKELGYNYVASHISDGRDFFKWEPDKWDIAISNPPFSKELKVFERLYSFNKPFAMVMNLMCINYSEIGYFFADHPIELLVPDKKISFDGHTSSFCSGYVCRDVLTSDLEFVHVPHNNANKYFVPSRMLANPPKC
jgi:hypothetical protein